MLDKEYNCFKFLLSKSILHKQAHFGLCFWQILDRDLWLKILSWCKFLFLKVTQISMFSPVLEVHLERVLQWTWSARHFSSAAREKIHLCRQQASTNLPQNMSTNYKPQSVRHSACIPPPLLTNLFSSMSVFLYQIVHVSSCYIPSAPHLESKGDYRGQWGAPETCSSSSDSWSSASGTSCKATTTPSWSSNASRTSWTWTTRPHPLPPHGLQQRKNKILVEKNCERVKYRGDWTFVGTLMRICG